MSSSLRCPDGTNTRGQGCFAQPGPSCSRSYLAQQKLVSKVREGAKEDTLAGLNPAAIQRQIQALTGELLATATSNAPATSRPPVTSRAGREPAQQAAS